jgi:methionine sulfoxide reductase heme-binding subunit
LPARPGGYRLGQVELVGGIWPPVTAQAGGAAVAARAGAFGSQDLWYVSRASGLVLLVLFSVLVVLGIVARMGSTPKGWPRFVFVELHRTLALFCVAFLVLHVVTAILDPFVTIGWAATVVPFTSAYRTLQIGLGTLAVDFGGAVVITSLLRVRLGFRSWRLVHWLSYIAWPVAFVHTLTAGNDLGIWWVALVEWSCAAAVAVAAVARVLFAARGGTVPGTPDASGVPPEIPADFFSRSRAHR